MKHIDLETFARQIHRIHVLLDSVIGALFQTIQEMELMH